MAFKVGISKETCKWIHFIEAAGQTLWEIRKRLWHLRNEKIQRNMERPDTVAALNKFPSAESTKKQVESVLRQVRRCVVTSRPELVISSVAPPPK